MHATQMLVWTTGINKGFSKEMKPILDLELSALGGEQNEKRYMGENMHGQ